MIGEAEINRKKSGQFRLLKSILSLMIVLISLPFFADVYYVRHDAPDGGDGLSWSTAYNAIEDGLANAVAEDDIWVTSGNYQISNTIEIPENISLYGGFSGEELLLSERNIDAYHSIIDGNDSLLCVQNHGLIDGFHITHGNSGVGGIENRGTVRYCELYENIGAFYSGIYMLSGLVTNCNIRGFSDVNMSSGTGVGLEGGVLQDSVISNHKGAQGGGVKNYSGTVQRCEIYENYDMSSVSGGNFYEEGGGGIFNLAGLVSHCRVYQNMTSASGGGINNISGTVEFCEVFQNSAVHRAGGIYFDYSGEYGEGYVRNCEIYDNESLYSSGGFDCRGVAENCRIFANSTAGFGGGVLVSGTLINCLIYDNEADAGGGIYNCGRVRNCTVANNSADIGGGMYCYGEITNSIIWHNFPDEIYKASNDDLVTYTCSSSLINGNGNISADPMFVNISGERLTWDFHLLADSPCIDAGSLVNMPEIDLEGISRPVGSGNDMGAFEYFDSVEFGVNLQSVSIEQTLFFFGQSTKNVTSWQWDFNEDGTVDSTLQNPIYYYDEPGLYDVSLTVVYEDGLNDTVVRHDYISVAPLDGPWLEAELIEIDIPAVMDAGKHYQGKITLKNIGLNVWKESDWVRLGAVDDSDSLSVILRYILDKDVRYGESYTFLLDLYSDQPGTYMTDWMMVKDGAMWFGEGAAQQVTVQSRTAVSDACWALFQ